jgi:ATP-binding cassette subfamily F protein uup
MAFFVSKQQSAGRTDHRGKYFASDNETLKVIEAMKSIRTPRRRRNLSKAFDGMDQHNAWDFETHRQILFKLKLKISN